MTALLDRLSTPGWTDLVLALLHTLWQGAVLAGLLYVVLRLLPARRANARYVISLVALAGVLICALVTCRIVTESPKPETVEHVQSVHTSDPLADEEEEAFIEALPMTNRPRVQRGSAGLPLSGLRVRRVCSFGRSWRTAVPVVSDARRVLSRMSTSADS